MVAHLCAYYQSTFNITDFAINTVVDDILTRTSPERFMIPAGMNYVGWQYAAATNLTRSRLFTPSLEVKRFLAITNPHRIGGVLPPLDIPRVCKYDPLLELVPTEELQFRFSVGGTAAQDIYGLVFLQAGPLPPVPAGERKIIRCTSTTTLTKGVWTTVRLTPDIALEAGTYALIWFIAISTNVIAARVMIPGQVWRPGMLGFPGSEDAALAFAHEYKVIFPQFEMGRFGHLQIPEFQFLANAADTSEVVYLFLVKIA